MVSRVVTRMVLVSIIATLIYALWWTWTTDFEVEVIGRRVLLTTVESSVLLAALSLLFESFHSFGQITVRKGSWKYILFGIHLIDGGNQYSDVSVRTCKLFGVRSFILSLFGVMLLVLLFCAYLLLNAALWFLFDPHMPVINWYKVFGIVGLIVVAFIIMALLLTGQEWMEKQLAKSSAPAKFIVYTLYWSVAFGLGMGIFSALDSGSGFNDMPIYTLILMATGVALAFAFVIITVIGLAYGIYKLAGNVVQRFTVLENVYNQFCPVQTVRFIK